MNEPIATSLMDSFLRYRTRIWNAEEDVVANRSSEHGWFLSYERQISSVVVHVHVIDVDAIAGDRTLPRIDIVESFQQRDDGCLAAARRADESCVLAFLNDNVQVLKDGDVASRIFE